VLAGADGPTLRNSSISCSSRRQPFRRQLLHQSDPKRKFGSPGSATAPRPTQLPASSSTPSIQASGLAREDQEDRGTFIVPPTQPRGSEAEVGEGVKELAESRRGHGRRWREERRVRLEPSLVWCVWQPARILCYAIGYVCVVMGPVWCGVSGSRPGDYVMLLVMCVYKMSPVWCAVSGSRPGYYVMSCRLVEVEGDGRDSHREDRGALIGGELGG